MLWLVSLCLLSSVEGNVPIRIPWSVALFLCYGASVGKGEIKALNLLTENKTIEELCLKNYFLEIINKIILQSILLSSVSPIYLELVYLLWGVSLFISQIEDLLCARHWGSNDEVDNTFVLKKLTAQWKWQTMTTK